MTTRKLAHTSLAVMLVLTALEGLQAAQPGSVIRFTDDQLASQSFYLNHLGLSSLLPALKGSKAVAAPAVVFPDRAHSSPSTGQDKDEEKESDANAGINAQWRKLAGYLKSRPSVSSDWAKESGVDAPALVSYLRSNAASLNWTRILSGPRVVFIGEDHRDPAVKTALARAIGASSVSHVGFEAFGGKEIQAFLDVYDSKTGKGKETLLGYLEKNWGHKPLSYFYLVHAARSLNVRPLALDFSPQEALQNHRRLEAHASNPGKICLLGNGGCQYRDCEMARRIVSAGPRARVAALVGSNHAEAGNLPAHLKRLYGMDSESYLFVYPDAREDFWTWNLVLLDLMKRAGYSGRNVFIHLPKEIAGYDAVIFEKAEEDLN